MSPDILNSSTLNELFESAYPLTDSITVTNSGDDHQVFVYKIVNNTNTDMSASTVFSVSFSGSAEIYNDAEFVNCSFDIDNTATINEITMYSISETYYENRHGTDLLSEPIEVDYLNNTIVTENAESVEFNIYIKPGKTAYILINIDPSTFVLNNTTTTSTYLPDAPSEPENTEPVFGETVEVHGSGNFNLAVNQDVVDSLSGSNVNVSVDATTDKVIQATIKYGQYSTTSNYYYNPNAVTDLIALREELVQATQNVGVVLLPLPGEASPAGLYSLVNANLSITEGASVEVVINAPLANTAIATAIKALASTDEIAIGPNDPWGNSPWRTYLRRRRYLKRRYGFRV
jgi:hypothetical protein